MEKPLKNAFSSTTLSPNSQSSGSPGNTAHAEHNFKPSISRAYLEEVVWVTSSWRTSRLRGRRLPRGQGFRYHCTRGEVVFSQSRSGCFIDGLIFFWEWWWHHFQVHYLNNYNKALVQYLLACCGWQPPPGTQNYYYYFKNEHQVLYLNNNNEPLVHYLLAGCGWQPLPGAWNYYCYLNNEPSLFI